jgi:4-hydroxybenzoate polyprenyltransferase
MTEKPESYTTKKRMVEIDKVARWASIIVGFSAIYSLATTYFTGGVIIQPFLALLLLIAAVGFYCMTLVPSRSERLHHDD